MHPVIGNTVELNNLEIEKMFDGRITDTSWFFCCQLFYQYPTQRFSILKNEALSIQSFRYLTFILRKQNF